MAEVEVRGQFAVPVSRRRARIVWTLATILTLISAAVVVRRFVVLTTQPTVAVANAAPNPAKKLDGNFISHRALTFAHIGPALVFVLLLPLQFVASIRSRVPRFHRWNGRFLVTLGIYVAATALIMSFTMAIGGAIETAATTLYALLLILFLCLGFRAARSRDFRHREWMIRAYGVTLGIATTRPIVGAFFAARRLQPQQFFGIAFWLGFTITLLAAEGWIIATRRLMQRG